MSFLQPRSTLQPLHSKDADQFKDSTSEIKPRTVITSGIHERSRRAVNNIDVDGLTDKMNKASKASISIKSLLEPMPPKTAGNTIDQEMRS